MRMRVVVRGRVQGVGFRWYVQEAVSSLDLAGWVRNASDGSVEVEAEGNTHDLEKLRAILRAGPSGARVETVDEIAAGTEPLERPFRIKR